MHFYSKARRFWGGSGIVGAQVPVGVGLGFANMYLAKKAWPTTISVAMYGDGAANQGQIWEAANMAKLWSIPTILLCENNQYGMGTSTARHSANAEYYKAGGVAIPGVQADGMDVLAVKEAVKYCRQHACVLAAGRRRRRCAARARRAPRSPAPLPLAPPPAQVVRQGPHLPGGQDVPVPRALDVRPGHHVPRPRRNRDDARVARLH